MPSLKDFYNQQKDDGNNVEVNLTPMLTAKDVAPKKNEITFEIKCKYRNYCRHWKRQEVKSCMYCRHNVYHLMPQDGFGLEDNYDSWVPGIWIPP